MKRLGNVRLIMENQVGKDWEMRWKLGLNRGYTKALSLLGNFITKRSCYLEQVVQATIDATTWS